MRRLDDLDHANHDGVVPPFGIGHDDEEINGSLRCMNANSPNDRGPSGGREMLAQIGGRPEQLERGAVPKHFEWRGAHEDGPGHGSRP